MELNQAIQTRRSIRKYKKESVSDKDIRSLIETTIYAPSWKNSQVTRYHVVKEEKILIKIKGALPDFNQENSKDAPVFIIPTIIKNRSGYNRDQTPTNELGNGWGLYDCGMSSMLLMLKAKELGLDTLVMGIRDQHKIKEILNIPDEEIITSVIALGYRDIEPEMPKRKNVDDIAKFY